LRIDFNVLWVDDQPKRVEAQIEKIAKLMTDEGFQFRPKLCKSMDDVIGAIKDNVFTDEVDLILVDWDLGGGIHGEDAITEIREIVPYKDVVFYSAQNDAEQLRKLAFERGLEGIYCAVRDELVDEVLGVFESLVKKVLDLDHTRGIVMGATSDIDSMVNECLVAIHLQLDAPGKEAMLKDALNYVERRMKTLAEAAAALQSAATISEMFEAHMILTAYDRLRLLGGALKAKGLEAHKEYRKSVVEYQQRVVPGRNILGHAVLVPEGKPVAITDSKGKPITLQETRDLRRLILRLRNDFRNLRLALQVQAAPAASNPADTK